MVSVVKGFLTLHGDPGFDEYGSLISIFWEESFDNVDHDLKSSAIPKLRWGHIENGRKLN